MKDLRKKFQIIFFQQGKQLIDIFIKDLNLLETTDIPIELSESKNIKILSNTIIETKGSEICKVTAIGSNKYYSQTDIISPGSKINVSSQDYSIYNTLDTKLISKGVPIRSLHTCSITANVFSTIIKQRLGSEIDNATANHVYNKITTVLEQQLGSYIKTNQVQDIYNKIITYIIAPCICKVIPVNVYKIYNHDKTQAMLDEYTFVPSICTQLNYIWTDINSVQVIYDKEKFIPKVDSVEPFWAVKDITIVKDFNSNAYIAFVPQVYRVYLKNTSNLTSGKDIKTALITQITAINSKLLNTLTTSSKFILDADDTLIYLNAKKDIACVVSDSLDKIALITPTAIKLKNTTIIKAQTKANIICSPGYATLDYYKNYTLAELQEYSLFDMKYKIFN